MALVVGAAFFNLQLTSRGAFVRGSLLYLGLMNCCFDTFGEVRPWSLEYI